jgi:hypothetical protein
MSTANPELDPNRGRKLELAAAQKVSHVNKGTSLRFSFFVLEMIMYLFALLIKQN